MKKSVKTSVILLKRIYNRVTVNNYGDIYQEESEIF